MPSTNSFHETPRTKVGKQVLFPQLSYEILGAVFEVNKRLGFGYLEKVYQEAFARELEFRGLRFHRENFSRINYKEKKVGGLFYDFLVEGKIVVELKVAKDLYEDHINQLLSYLKDSKLKLGLLVVFTPKGVVYRRVIH